MTGWRFALCLGVFFAFSPTLIDLLQHAHDHAWARASLVFPWLAWLVWREEDADPRPVGWGWSIVGLGLFVQLAALAGDVVRLGRLGLALGIVGLCRGAGWGSWKVSALLVMAIPMPHFLIASASPGLESSLGWVGSQIAHGFGLLIESDGSDLIASHGVLKLLPVDGGLGLVVMLSVLGGFGLVHESPSARQVIGHCARLGLLGVPAQLFAVVCVVLALGLGFDAALLREALSWFPWLLIWFAAFGVVWTKRIRVDSNEKMS